jgi:CheY-like chemotaxis protein
VSSAVEPVQPVEVSPEARAGVALTGLTVYCIDNDARILDGMRLLIERWGCRVYGFAGVAAIEEARSTLPPPDLVLADYHLDGENGLDAIRRLRAMFGSGMPAVLVTADRSSEVRAASEALDVPVLNKPVKPAALRSLMTRMRKLTLAAAAE